MDIYISVIHSDAFRLTTSLPLDCDVIYSRDRMKGHVIAPAVISVICIVIVGVLAVVRMNQPVYVLQRVTHPMANVMSQADFIR